MLVACRRCTPTSSTPTPRSCSGSSLRSSRSEQLCRSSAFRRRGPTTRIPMPLATGMPADGYPWEWGVYSWLPGRNPAPGDVPMADLVELLRAFREIELPDAPPTRRGKPLLSQDEWVRAALVELEGIIDTEAATAEWD